MPILEMSAASECSFVAEAASPSDMQAAVIAHAGEAHPELRIFRSMGCSVFGLSAQSPEYQAEMVERLHVTFPVLSDSDRQLGEALNLPTMDAGGMTLYKRLTMIVTEGRIEHVMYPVFPPDRNAQEVVDWLAVNR